jgi:hypothetical protein
MNHIYLILWLSVHNGKAALDLLEKPLIRLLIPTRILEPLIYLIVEKRTDRVYAADEVPDDTLASLQVLDDKPISKYIAPCSAVVFRASDLLLVRIMGLPGFVTDFDGNRVEHRVNFLRLCRTYLAISRHRVKMA